MMMNAAKINWARTGDALPAFLAIAIMPLTYSIGEFVAQRMCGPGHVRAWPCQGLLQRQGRAC